MENEKYAREVDDSKERGHSGVIEEHINPSVQANQRDGERRQLLEEPQEWWYINTFCCCCEKRGAAQFIICWDIFLYLITALFCILMCSSHGGSVNFPGQALKYLSLIQNLFYLIRVVPGAACLFAGTPKPAFKFVVIPRIISMIGILIILIINSIASSRVLHAVDRALVSQLIVIILIIIFDGYCIMAIKSYSVSPPKQWELQRDDSTSQVVVAYQPNFVPSQKQPANMQMAYIGQPVPKQQNFPQQNYEPQIQQPSYQQQNIQPLNPKNF
jgi:hypothetical protein